MIKPDHTSTRRTRRVNQAIDPVLAVIRAGHELLAAYRVAGTFPDAPTHALFDHLHGPLFNTAPTTPEGGVALAKYITEFSDTVGDTLEDEALKIIALIGRVKLT